jgi:hypothetical protein
VIARELLPKAANLKLLRVGIERLEPHDLRSYAESEIMPNRDSEMPSNPRESCPIVCRATRSMRHNLLCVTGHG